MIYVEIGEKYGTVQSTAKQNPWNIPCEACQIPESVQRTGCKNRNRGITPTCDALHIGNLVSRTIWGYISTLKRSRHIYTSVFSLKRIHACACRCQVELSSQYLEVHWDLLRLLWLNEKRGGVEYTCSFDIIGEIEVLRPKRNIFFLSLPNYRLPHGHIRLFHVTYTRFGATQLAFRRSSHSEADYESVQDELECGTWWRLRKRFRAPPVSSGDPLPDQKPFDPMAQLHETAKFSSQGTELLSPAAGWHVARR